MFHNSDESASPGSVRFMDAGSKLLDYLLDIGKNNRETTLENDRVSFKDGQNYRTMLVGPQEDTRRVLETLRHSCNAREMLEMCGSVIVKVTDAEGNTLLLRAVKDGHEELVSLLLKHGADVDHQNNDHNTPLILAVDRLCETIVSCILQAGGNANCVNRKFETPLKLACSRGNIEITNCLLRAGASPNYMSQPGDTCLTRACFVGNISIIKSLLMAGADVNSVYNIYSNGLSPLMLAAKRQQLSIVHALLQAGADINSPNNLYEAGDTPLIHVTRLSLVEIIHIFALAGADVNAKNAIGQSALTVAIRYRKNDAVNCLLTHEADVNQRTKSGDTPLILAAENGSAMVCQEFIARGAILDSVNDHGDTALIQAARNGHYEVMKVLIDAGINVNHVNKSKMTALRFAVGQSLFHCSPCLMYLLDSGVRIHSELHYAVTLGLTHVVKQLLAYNALPQAIDAGWLSFIPSLPQLSCVSPLCVALITERIEIVQQFLELGFLTDLDLKILHRDPWFRQHLKDNSRSESLHFLDFVLPVPLSLHSLSLLAVSKAVTFDFNTRQARVTATGLPPMLQRKLLFVS